MMLMVMIEHPTGNFHMNDDLVENLKRAKRAIVKDWDFIFAIDGVERGGKSLLAQQMAYFCDPTFCIERITFTPDEFKRAIINADKYQAVIYDEAYTGLISRNSMKEVNVTLVRMMAEIGQKNLFVFVVMPTYFDLDKYVAVWRSRALVHIYTGDDFERGYFGFYNSDKKKDLFILGKKYYSYKTPKPNFTGRFVNKYIVDKDTYRQKKSDTLKKYERKESAEIHALALEVQELLFERLQNPELNLTHREKIIILNMKEATYYYKLRKFKKNSDIEVIS